MNPFGRDKHHCDDPWDGAPAYIIELGEMAGFIIHQLDIVLAFLAESPSKLPPADQAKLNAIFAKVAATRAKLDAALPKA